MNKKQDQFSSIEIAVPHIYINNTLQYETIENIRAIFKYIDENISPEDPQFAAIIWKFIYNDR